MKTYVKSNDPNVYYTDDDGDGVFDDVHYVVGNSSSDADFLRGQADLDGDGVYDDIIDAPIINNGASIPAAAPLEDNSSSYSTAATSGSFGSFKPNLKAVAIVAGGFIAFAIISFLATAARVIF